ncbi:MAG: hypothetical protein QOI63_349 [Thermoplasmata archaeon]|jgi:hypothetical protein|nr:hypothetical protein [Thermoplasmata archaeon]
MNPATQTAAILGALLLLVPAASAATYVAAEPFTNPTYTTTRTAGLGAGLCELYEDRVSTQAWFPAPYGPPGPPAGPTHPMHTAGSFGGATGWHQGYSMHVHRVYRTDSPALAGLCGTAIIPWISSITTEYQVFGGGSLAAPTDLIDVTLEGTANTLLAFAAASGATVTGGCGGSFGPPPAPAPFNPVTNTCSLPPVTLAFGGTHNFYFTATASNPVAQIDFEAYETNQDTFYFHSVPTPGTGTPGGPTTDELDLVFDV